MSGTPEYPDFVPNEYQQSIIEEVGRNGLIKLMVVKKWLGYNTTYRVWGNQSVPDDFRGIPEWKSNLQSVSTCRFQILNIARANPNFIGNIIAGAFSTLEFIEQDKKEKWSSDPEEPRIDYYQTRCAIDEVIVSFGPAALPWLDSLSIDTEKISMKATRGWAKQIRKVEAKKAEEIRKKEEALLSRGRLMIFGRRIF